MNDSTDAGADSGAKRAGQYRSIFRGDLFEGRRIIVTGGGSGIGRCIAHELASLGAAVSLIGRSIEKLQTVRDEIAAAGHTPPSVHTCDIRVEPQVETVVREVCALGSPIRGLVNNAGGQFRAPLRDISANGWDAVVRNNLTGGFLFARECFRASMEAHGGAIVSVLANMWQSMPGMGHSGAARAGLLNFTQTAALEWAHAGVRVNAVAPGLIASSGLDTYPASFRPTMLQQRDWIPLQRAGTESEVSSAVVYLLSEGAAFVTGTCIRIDGGEPNRRVDWTVPPHRRSRPYHGLPENRQGSWLDRGSPHADEAG